MFSYVYCMRMNASAATYPTRIRVLTCSVSVINFDEWFYDCGKKKREKSGKNDV